MAHMRNHGWKINPDKVQGPAQRVKFLGICWNKGEREITDKAKNKILAFAVPHSQQDVQKFIGLFGYWRQHIPHPGTDWVLTKVIKRKWSEPRWTGPYRITERKSHTVRVQGKGDIWYHWSQCAAAAEPQRSLTQISGDLQAVNNTAEETEGQTSEGAE